MRNGTNRVFKNAGALFTIQLLNYALPLVLLPYLTRVLGLELYGVVAIGLSMVIIASTISDFGFSISATHNISQLGNDKEKISGVIGAVFAAKVMLLLIITPFYTAFVLFNSRYESHQILFAIFFLSILSQAFQPNWLFQGIERMGFITAYTTLSRILYIIMVVVFVKNPEDSAWVALAHGLSFTVSTILSLILMVRLGYSPKWTSVRFLRDTIRETWGFFGAKASVAVYTAGGVFFLGLTSGASQAALYSAAEQLYKAAQALVMPVSQALFPYMSRVKNFSLLFVVLKITIIGSLIGGFFAVIFGEYALGIVFGQDFKDSYPVLVVFVITFVMSASSLLLGYPFLGAMGQSRLVNSSALWAGLLQIIFLAVLFLIHQEGGVYVALSVLAVEIVVLSLRIVWGIRTYKLTYGGR